MGTPTLAVDSFGGQNDRQNYPCVYPPMIVSRSDPSAILRDHASVHSSDTYISATLNVAKRDEIQ